MLAKSIWWKGWLIWWYRIKGGSPENRSKPLEYHKKSYFRSWSFIFADYPERKFDCTLTSKFSMKLQWNLSWRGCKINFRTSRFWNCNCFLDLIMISWRNHCLENVNAALARFIEDNLAAATLVPFSEYFVIHLRHVMCYKLQIFSNDNICKCKVFITAPAIPRACALHALQQAVDKRYISRIDWLLSYLTF